MIGFTLRLHEVLACRRGWTPVQVPMSRPVAFWMAVRNFIRRH